MRTGENAQEPTWQFWIDRGGTFTDIVALSRDGSVHTLKLLSENAEHYRDAALHGIRRVLGIAAQAPIPGELVDAIKMGTTVGTNALLERKGERTLFVTTRGFADVLRIGYQARPKIFARRIELPSMLYERVVEVDERYGADGTELRPVDLAAARTGLEEAYQQGFRACAIAFMHAYRYPGHEVAVAELAREIGFTQVSVSHQVSPLMKLVGRGDTTVADAYLSPLLRRYVDEVASQADGARLMFMQSNGGLTDARLFQGKDSVLSGPAGGIVGAVRTAEMTGFNRIISFDMGGTSTDVAHYDGAYERSFETEVAGIRLRAPMMRIHTVAAGGGSVCLFDGERYRVGPESAGANPGPASYGRGGPLTVTDCNVMLGKLQPVFFPHLFGPSGDAPLDDKVVRRKFETLAERIRVATGDERTSMEVADGFLKIAVANMANAIKRISVQRGYDVTGYVLNAFGGAGGQHACLVADALGMDTILLHPMAGVLSAYGMGLADVRAMREQAVELELSDECLEKLDAVLVRLEASALAELGEQGISEGRVRLSRKLHLKYLGTDTSLIVPWADLDSIREAFDAVHRQRYGFVMNGKAVVVEAISLEAVGHTGVTAEPAVLAEDETGTLEALAIVPAYMDGERRDTPVFDREDLRPGHSVCGPAIIQEATGTTVVEPGWWAQVLRGGQLILKRLYPRPKKVTLGTDADPVMLEIFNNLFMSIAEQMGGVLRNTATSVNIKERLDFSCAVFDAEGALIANAPHIPVHLGSMGESVREVMRRRGTALRPGDVYVLNDPYHGGTHLPDVTVVTPVFDSAGESVLFYVGSRGHHADIGGKTPGSIPPDSHRIEEEGVLIDVFQIVREGRFLEQETVALLKSGDYPARNVAQNLADLRAQIAANEKGVQELGNMVERYGLNVVQAYMGHVQANAEAQVRAVLGSLDGGAFRLEMDNGGQVCVKVDVDRRARSAVVDFTGTSAQLENNFNAPTAVCRAAVLYVFRTLVDDDIPLNEGCLKPLRIVIPRGCFLNPEYPAAVVAGNVETSQCVTDALFGALGAMAASQGTMNNVTFGNERYQYYETICGGAGAGPGFDGASAVHTHMTNSRLTDPEVLEWRFPVVLEAFEIRRGSGGVGKNQGGDGAIRRIRFLQPMTVAIVSNHRRVPPFGLDGGGAGACGTARIEYADGRVQPLMGTAQAQVREGDVFVVETPGGGGFGPPPAS